MKLLKTVLLSMVMCSCIIMTSCANSNQKNVVANTNTELITLKAETASNETTKAIEQTAEETKKEQQVLSNQSNTNTKDVLVSYFSATGTTKKVAEKIAQIENADLYEIIPSNPYTSDDLNWHDSNSRTTKEMNDEKTRPQIGSVDIDLSKYNTIYLGYPIWWGDAPRIMSTFVEKYNFDGKKVIPFCTSGSSGIGRSGSNLSKIAGKGNWLNGERLNSSADTNSIQNFINKNK